LYKYGVKVLGTPVKAIEDTEDRERFVERLNEIGAKTARSRACVNTSDRPSKIVTRAAYWRRRQR
jgi:carbamoyl-phosphate synthase large subunit